MHAFLMLLLLGCGLLPLGAIDVATERLVTLLELARRLPSRRSGRPVHLTTVHRWRCRGIRGIRLECICVGGAWHTSIEAFQRFCDRLSGHEETEVRETAPKRQGKSHEQVDRELDHLFGDR